MDIQSVFIFPKAVLSAINLKKLYKKEEYKVVIMITTLYQRHKNINKRIFSTVSY
jgi:hypothetical protein